MHRPAAVNEALYAICQNIRLSDGHRLIEGEGGGILAAQQALVDAGLRKAHIIDEGIQVRVCLLYTSWIEKTRAFTEATRAEEGNKFFEWSRSVEDPNEFVLLEAFNDDAAGPHVNSDHFQQAMKDMRPLLTATPKIVSRLVDGDGWDAMGELQID